MDPTRHRALTEALAQGDQRALEPLLELHRPALEAFLRLRVDARTRARESAQDLAQSVCREVLQHAHTFRHPDEEGFRRWLFTMALRKLRDRQDFHHAQKRELAREVELDAEGLVRAYASLVTPSRVASAREELGRVEAILAKLPEEQREVIALHRIAGLSHAEIAEHLGKSEGATRMLLHRALARLVVEVERQPSEDGPRPE